MAVNGKGEMQKGNNCTIRWIEVIYNAINVFISNGMQMKSIPSKMKLSQRLTICFHEMRKLQNR